MKSNNNYVIVVSLFTSTVACIAYLYTCKPNFIKLSVTVHELSCEQRKNSDEDNTVDRYPGQEIFTVHSSSSSSSSSKWQL